MKYRLDAPLDELLDMARETFDVAFEPLAVMGSTIDVLQVTNMREYLDRMVPNIKEDALKELPLWAKVWPASVVLGHFMRHFAGEDKTLLEIGAGCGVTGIIAAHHGFSEVVISDIEDDALLFAQINVLKNNLQDTVKVRRIDITETRLDRTFDVIAGAEVLYMESLHRPLIKFIRHHLASGPDCEAVLAKDYKRKAKKFFKLAERDFQMAERTVGTKTVNEQDETERALFTIHRLRKK